MQSVDSEEKLVTGFFCQGAWPGGIIVSDQGCEPCGKTVWLLGKRGTGALAEKSLVVLYLAGKNNREVQILPETFLFAGGCGLAAKLRLHQCHEIDEHL